MNEGELLEFCNDLKDQYDTMKRKYQKRIAMLEHTIKRLKEDKTPQYRYINGQFDSSRPFATVGKQTSLPEFEYRKCLCGNICIKNSLCVFCG